MIHVGNFEHTKLQNDYFPFNTFYIDNENTLSHWHNHAEIIYINDGICHIYINGNLYIGQAGDIIIAPPNSLHTVLVKKQSTYYAIVIGNTLLDAVKESLTGPVHLQKNVDHYASLHGSIKNILIESTNRLKFYENIIKIELYKFFTILMRHFEGSPTQDNPVHSWTIHLKKVLEYLSIHYTKKLTISDMSKLINVSEQHFSRLFKAYTGKTFIEYLTLLRLEHANRLLLDTDIPITQIPELTGFCNPNYFSRVYKKNYGQAPSKKRKSL